VDNGATTLALVGNLFELNPHGGGTGPLLELNGSVVIQGQLGSWAPVGALKTGDGYEVAFGNGANQYVIWNVGSNGNYISKATGILAGNSLELQGVEAAFNDGTFLGGASAPVTATTIVDNHTTTLASVGNLFELNPDSAGTGPLLELNGSVVTNSQFGAAGWTPVGALQTGTGYEVAFKSAAGTYVVWNTDGNGDYTSKATVVLSSSNSTQAIELAGLEAAFGETFAAGVTAAAPTNIATGVTGTPGATQLDELEVSGSGSQKGDAYELNAPGKTGGPLLELNGKLVTQGQFGAAGWAPVGAVETLENSTPTGYEVAFSNGSGKFVVWNVGLNGDYTSNATGILSGTSYALESLETTFGVDLNGDGTTGPTTTPIGTNGALDQVANQFQLNPGASVPLFLTLNGSPVTTTTFTAGWTPVGAVQTETGYDLAFGNPSGQFVVWNVDSSGNYVSSATSVLPKTSNELAGVEGNFGENFAGAGVSKASPSKIASNGTTMLNSVGNLFELTSVASGTGPLLELNGSVVTSGQFTAGWTPVGALQTGNGYEVAFKSTAGTYVVWNTDANGNFTNNATPVLSANTPTIEAVEANFGETFTGAGTPATPTTIADNLTTTLASVGNLFELNPDSGGTGPLLELHGSAVTSGSLGGWTPVGALKTATGYEVAFSAPTSTPGQNQFVVWNTDSNGDYTSNATGVLAGNSLELQGVEAAFGDPTFAHASAPATANPIGTPTPNGQLAELEVEVNGKLTSQNGDAYELGGTGGPLLELGGSVVTAGGLGGWTPVGAQKTSTGYEVVWNNLLTPDEYTVWNTDAGGNYTSSALGLVSGQNFMLEDLNPVWGENVSGAPSLSTFLATTVNQANTDAQQGNTTINLGNNSAFASNGLSGANSSFTPTISGTPFALTLGSHADIIEYTLTPASGIETIANFGANDELNVNLRGLTPDSALLFRDITVNGAPAVSIFSNADPAHGVVLLNPMVNGVDVLAATLQAGAQFVGGAIGQGHGADHGLIAEQSAAAR
jgi:hypothetical protein